MNKPIATIPLVSIVTATYNSGRFILDTYRSILKQSIQDWEWIITDDCSSDDTIDILTDIVSSDNRVKLLQNKVNSGAAVSRNKCLSVCSGKFIAFIDSDDLWNEEKLKKQIDFMEDGYDFSFTGYELIDEKGQRLNISMNLQPLAPITYNDMLKKKATLGCSTVILRAERFKHIEMPLLKLDRIMLYG